MTFESPDSDLSYDQFVAPVFDEGGVYLLESPKGACSQDDARLRRDEQPLHAYDDATRGVHPRSELAGQRYPGPMGAGRKEGFSHPLWQRRGGDREARYVLDEAMWDPRPPHFNPQAGAEHAHLAHLPSFRGAARVDPGLTRSQAMTTIDEQFTSRPCAAHACAKCAESAARSCPAAPAAGLLAAGGLARGLSLTVGSLELAKTALFFVIVILVAMWVVVSSYSLGARSAARQDRAGLEASLGRSIKDALAGTETR